jgi:hypothetical protein
MIVFAAGDTSAKTIMVRLVDGTVLTPGSMVETISSSLRSADPTFNRVAVPNVYVNGFLTECAPITPVVPASTAVTPLLPATGSVVPLVVPLLALLAILAGLGVLVLAGIRRRRNGD